MDAVEEPDLPRVLSVQSHVVSGYVGNRAAVFPLQLLGFDVDFVNSVQFSNHTKYRTMKGSVLSGDDLRELSVGLGSNDLLQYDYLLTGYIGSESFLRSVLDLLADIQKARSSVRYICDPVLGDEGRYYVPSELVQVYRDVVLPRAYMVTPNQFEAELLSGVTIRTEVDVLAAAAALVARGPEVVIITSAELQDSPGKLCCYATRLLKGDGGKKQLEVNKIIVSKQDAHFTGTGDATAALLLAWTHLLSPQRLGGALQNAIGSIQSIIAQVARKQARALEALSPEDVRDARVLRSAEFSVVQGRRHIEHPPSDAYPVTTWVVDMAANA